MFPKVYGCLAGLALGDALGMPSEFLTPEEIKAALGRLENFLPAPEYHPHRILPPGSVTDDTGQALAIARACQPDGNLTAESAARALLAWEDACPPHILAVIEGPSTREALAAIRRGADPRRSGLKGKTNGAAMRAAAAGLLHPGDLAGAVQAAAEASLPTHATGPGISGACAVACAVAEACRPQAALDAVLQAAIWGAEEGARLGAWAWSTPLSGRMELALTLVSQAGSEEDALDRLYRFVGVDMLVPESVAAALGIAALAGGEPMRAARLGANIGGDTDTIAAIAGQICGALAGIESIDRPLLEELERVNGLDLEQEAQQLSDAIERSRRPAA